MARQRARPSSALTSLPSPLRILRQIVLLQLGYYAAAVALILFTSLVFGARFHPDLILGWEVLRGDTAVGWTLGLCWMVDAGVGVILLLLLISRSKLVPDFALTLHAIHLLLTSLYSRSLPRNALWWALQAASAALMTSLGIWACRWRELRPMNFGAAAVAAAVAGVSGPNGNGVGKAKATPALPPPGGMDLEDGFGGDYTGSENVDVRAAGKRAVDDMAGSGDGILSRMFARARRATVGGDGRRGDYEMVGMQGRLD